MLNRMGVLAVLVICGGPAAHAEGPQPAALFNGSDFTGWQEPEPNPWWTIEDGILTAGSDPEKKGSTLWTQRDYRDFVLELEFRFGRNDVDSGVFLRDENEQIQFGVSRSLRRDMTGSPYIASKGGYPAEAEGVQDLLRQEDWNAVRIRAVGSRYTVWLNGEQVLVYDSETAVEQGPVGLQLHSGVDMSIDFRNIRLAELPAEPAETE